MQHSRKCRAEGAIEEPEGIATIATNTAGAGTVQCRFEGAVCEPATDHSNRPNHTGMPDRLKSGLEHLSGFDLSPVRVHYNSPKPAQLGALAYAQGTEIHLGQGQERHLPHEGWHVVQQMQGRVKPTMQKKDASINNDGGLEREADRMGARALQMKAGGDNRAKDRDSLQTSVAGIPPGGGGVLQRKVGFEFETPWVLMAPARVLGPDTAVTTGVGWELVPDFASTLLAQLPPELQETETEEPAWFGLSSRTVRHPPKYAGFGHMEFVTDAYEESETGLAELIATLYSIKFFVQDLQTSIGREVPLHPRIKGKVKWSEHVSGFSKSVQENIVVNNTPAFTATPQMSAGIKLSQIPKLLNMMGGNTPFARYLNRGRAADEDGSHPRLISQAMSAAAPVVTNNPSHGGWNATQQNQYLGAVAHLTYIVLAGKISDPQKTKYLTTLLSRTDFGKLPDFILDPGTNLKADVLTAAGALGTDYLFGGQHKASKIKVGDWLDGIVAGKDPIDWGQDRKNVEKNRRWDPQDVGQESDQETGHVYEFRGAGTNLGNLDDWMKYALGLFELVKCINDSSNTTPNKDSDSGKRILNLPNLG